jgi:hypothetical protein
VQERRAICEAKGPKLRREREKSKGQRPHARTHAWSRSLFLVSVRSEWKHVTSQLARDGTPHRPITRLQCVLALSYGPMETLRLVWLIGSLPTLVIPFHTCTPGVLKLLTSLHKSVISVFPFTLAGWRQGGGGEPLVFPPSFRSCTWGTTAVLFDFTLGEQEVLSRSHWGTTGLSNFCFLLFTLLRSEIQSQKGAGRGKFRGVVVVIQPKLLLHCFRAVAPTG